MVSLGMHEKTKKLVIIGGGAAGFFAAIRAAELDPELDVTLLERGAEVLNKVRISGGGRCNVTHACFDPAELVHYYPRGQKELLGPFYRFSPSDTVQWFENRGVRLKTESDGRMFPVSNNSASIVGCLLSEAARLHVKVIKQQKVVKLIPPAHAHSLWQILTPDHTWLAHDLLVTTGSNPTVWQMIKNLGHEIVPPVPSLFTFNIRDNRLTDLEGIALPKARVIIPHTSFETDGPVLITHWGLSGPAILKLSAWAATALHACGYQFPVVINWVGRDPEDLTQDILAFKAENGKKLLRNVHPFELPARFWKKVLGYLRFKDDLQWANLNKTQLQDLVAQLCAATFQVNGKSTFKEEFVTAGGVHLQEINFKTFASRKVPHLYFAGEVLNIDAVTGGFNFQAAWTGAWIAATAISSQPDASPANR